MIKNLKIKVTVWVIIIGLIVGAYYVGLLITEQQAEEQLPFVREEFNKIVIPSNAHKVEYNEMTAPGNTIVSGEYYSALSFDEVKDHYNDQLIRNGWVYLAEDKVIDRANNYERSMLYYKKNKYCGRLGSSGYLNKPTHINYFFVISWEIGSPCDAYD